MNTGAMIPASTKGKGINLAGTQPTVYNKILTTNGTEYSQALPLNTTRFTLQARTAVDVKLCYTASGSGTTYLTVKSGSSYTEENIDCKDITLYMQAGSDGIVVEIVTWSV